ncbi:hypothetical protein DNK49_20325 [Azoarcus communis]|uniref:DUF945 domain-containing protein n=2 Tax=Parazoarcus communis TaxID=41977 RepID=A0A323V3K9_9RHOO|nr:hypothetical protein DNK49_20325 [Azoarcus communis] [Parazoarcus communis SWub3 = DSM 12120]
MHTACGRIRRHAPVTLLQLVSSMSHPGKTLKRATLAISVAAAVWLGASVYGSSLAEQAIRDFAARPVSETGLIIGPLQHDRGWLSSSGHFGVAFVQGPGDQLAPGPLMEVRYTLSHLILPNSRLRVEWSVQPTGELADTLTPVFGDSLQIKGTGRQGHDGTMHSEFGTSDIVADDGETRVAIGPSTGSVVVADNTLKLDWRIGKLAMASPEDDLELTGATMAVNLTNTRIGTGTTVIEVERIASSAIDLQGVRHATEVVERADRLDGVVQHGLRAGEIAGVSVRDLNLDISLTGLDKASLETLHRVFSDTAGLQNLSPEDDISFRKALTTLINSGLSIGITRLTGTVGQGAVEGHLQIVAAPANVLDGPVSLATTLRANGELTLKDGTLPPEQAAIAVGMGLMQPVPGALKAQFDYAQGVLQTNGQAEGGAEVLDTLAEADAMLNVFLNTSLIATDDEEVEKDEEDFPLMEEEALAPTPTSLPVGESER